MAKKVSVELVDDIDGSPADETIRWAWEGQPLTVDLSKKNADKFRKDVERYLNASTPDTEAPRPGRAPARKRAGGGSGRGDVAQVRAWARENGHTVPDRGRLKPEIYEAYDKANA